MSALKRFPVEIRDLSKHYGEVGEIAGDEQLAVLGLAPRTRSLEEAFIALTGAQS